MFLVAFACSLVLCAPAVSGIKVFQDSISRAVAGSNNKTIRICDGQRDGNPVSARYQRFQSGGENSAGIQVIYDANGGDNNDCTSRFGRYGIFIHKTCESRGFDRVCNRDFSTH